jgi:hypothetical protein
MSGWKTDPSFNTFQGVTLREKAGTSKQTNFRRRDPVPHSRSSPPSDHPKKNFLPYFVITAIILIMALLVYYLRMDSI